MRQPGRTARALGAAFLLLAAACSPSAAPASSASAAPASQELLRIAAADLGNQAVDPLTGGSAQSGLYMHLMFDPLVGANKDQTEISKSTGIAKDWQVSSDFRTFTFDLRPGVPFQNDQGQVTAEDVKFSFERAVFDQKTTNDSASIIKSAFESVTVKDKSTIEFKFKTPLRLFLTLLSPLGGGPVYIMPKAYFERVGEKGFSDAPVGTGPYKLVENLVGSSITLRRAFDKHFAAGTPRFNSVKLFLVPEATTRAGLIRSGGADLIDASTSDAAQLGKEGFTLFAKPGGSQLWVFFPSTFKPGETDPTRDENLRKALSISVDRQGIATSLLEGLAKPAADYFLGQPGLVPQQPDPFDLAAAKDLMKKTPYGQGGQQLTLYMYTVPRPGWPPMVPFAELIQASWQKIGIKTVITQSDFPSFREKWGKANEALQRPTVILLTTPAQPDWLRITSQNWTCSGRTYGCWPAFEALRNKWAASATDAEYKQLANELNQMVVRDHLGILYVLLQQQMVGNKVVPKDYNPGVVGQDINTRGLIWGANGQ